MKLHQLREEIEGLPKSHDPYAPSKREKGPESAPDDDLAPPEPEEGEEGEEDEEIDDLLDQGEDELEDLPEEGGEEGEGEGEEEDEEFGLLPGEEELEGPEELTDLEPEKPIWEPYEVPNKRDLAFRRTDGFMLRARRLDAVPNKWAAQIWYGDKVLDQGMLFIPDDVEPELYVQEMADYMLDTGSNRFQQQGKPEPDEEEEIESLGPAPEELEEPGANEELGLDDEEFELDDEELDELE